LKNKTLLTLFLLIHFSFYLENTNYVIMKTPKRMLKMPKKWLLLVSMVIPIFDTSTTHFYNKKVYKETSSGSSSKVLFLWVCQDYLLNDEG